MRVKSIRCYDRLFVLSSVLVIYDVFSSYILYDSAGDRKSVV